MTVEMSVLFVNYNTWRECANAIYSLLRNPPTRDDGSPMPFECIVVDNASPLRDEEGIESLQDALDRVRRAMGDESAGQLILHPTNSGYSKGVNLCFRRSRGRWILVSNPDLLFTPGLIDRLRCALQTVPGAGCTVPKGFWDADFMGRLPPNIMPTLGDLFWNAAGEYSRSLSRRYSLWLAKDAAATWLDESPRPLRMMSGCLFLIERAFFEELGLMDERFPLYYEDADLSLRIRRKGRTVLQVPGAHLIHYVNRSGQTDEATVMRRHDESRRIYYRKWYGLPGYWLLRLEEWLMRSPRLSHLRREPPHGTYIDLGASPHRPRIVLPRRCERFLLQMSLDSRFYLSGGLLGTGSEWTPTDNMYWNFGPTTYWYRAFDLSQGKFEQIGVWRYRCTKGLGQAPALARDRA
ncbi:MAG: hypothetical protein Fur0037_11940 [Planctomycetota bacterium]